MGERELSFDAFERFIQSPDCIFTFRSLDFPTPLQQKLILSYYDLKELVARDHNDIVRTLHAASDRQLDSITSGVLYSVLLDANHTDFLFDNYMAILRNEAWQVLARTLFQVLRESFLAIRPSFRPPIATLLGRLYYFGQLNG